MNNTNHPLITVSEGRSLIYIFPAVFCGIGAIISFWFLPLLSFLLIAAVILFCLTETGLDYNPNTQQYRKYKSLFGEKWGSWEQAVYPEKFELRLSVERAYSKRAFSQIGSTTWYGNSTEIARSVTYDLSYSNSAEKSTIIFEFQSYKLAKQFITQLEALNAQPVIDYIAIKLQENYEKRMNRMR